jgi:hypothetical protein
MLSLRSAIGAQLYQVEAISEIVSSIIWVFKKLEQLCVGSYPFPHTTIIVVFMVVVLIFNYHAITRCHDTS